MAAPADFPAENRGSRAQIGQLLYHYFFFIGGDFYVFAPKTPVAAKNAEKKLYLFVGSLAENQ
ncbi:MAG: hypothetical protein IJ243_10905 [Prevotella sp.]|nr:hypothetical protein [Prevotella sp.]